MGNFVSINNTSSIINIELPKSDNNNNICPIKKDYSLIQMVLAILELPS